MGIFLSLRNGRPNLNIENDAFESVEEKLKIVIIVPGAESSISSV
jgi:hypothetical protein